ncbi:MAG: hypothetical protein KC643_16300, partial [Nitrospira sp.]|nr:hypothetical protein [Nitrospira sp.]
WYRYLSVLPKRTFVLTAIKFYPRRFDRIPYVRTFSGWFCAKFGYPQRALPLLSAMFDPRLQSPWLRA